MSTPVKKFDLIESANRGYQFFWHERALIIRLALPVLLLKFVSYLVIHMLGFTEAYLHQGLILLPAGFAEGWLLALLIRMEMFKERPATLTEFAKAPQKNALFAAAILFTLIKLITAFIAAFALENGLTELQQNTQNPEDVEQNLGIFLLAIAAFAACLWAFRLIWLYIPAAMDITSAHFLKSIKPFIYSFYFIGLWMVCSFPTMMALGFSIQFIGLLGPIDGDNLSTIQRVLVYGVQSITELIVSIISTLAIAHAIYALIFDSKPTKH